MKKANRFPLSTQLNLIFTIITILTSSLFILIFRRTMKEFITDQAKKHHESYHESIKSSFESGLRPVYSEHFATVEVEILSFTYSNVRYRVLYPQTVLNNVIDQSELNSIIKEFIFSGRIVTYYSTKINNRDIIGTVNKNNDDNLILTISSGGYRESLGAPVNNLIIVGFVAIIVLGNAIILLWSSITVEKIKRLEISVSNLSSDDYKKPVTLEGSDELTDLAKAIDEMRIEILENEKVKQDILQNVSHDIKTPIAVIQSYAEAIIDGVTDPSEAKVILKQTEVLARQAKQLIEWNKLEFIKHESEFELIDIKEIIINVVNNHKYRNDIEFELDLDDTKYLGVSENYYSVFSNLIDNALRYAENVIKITMKNKKLTFYNDGEHISEDFINHIFKPYEKGYKGQFGLGMTIVQKTLTNFNLKLTIENKNIGVAFIIEPEE